MLSIFISMASNRENNVQSSNVEWLVRSYVKDDIGNVRVDVNCNVRDLDTNSIWFNCIVNVDRKVGFHVCTHLREMEIEAPFNTVTVQCDVRHETLTGIKM